MYVLYRNTLLLLALARQRQYGSASEAFKHADGFAVVGVWLAVDAHALPNPELEALTRNLPRIKVCSSACLLDGLTLQ